MDKQYFIQLLKKHLNGQSTLEEDQFVISYYNLFQSEPDVLALLSDEQKEGLKQTIFDSIQGNIARIESRPAKVVSLQRWVRNTAAAAVVVLMLYKGFFLLYNQAVPVQKQPTPAVASLKKQNKFIELPDGSTALVSYSSQLRYAPSFNGASTRDVYLDGQAYFDIKHNPAQPFIVHTGTLETTVLGTAFEVRAIKKDSAITVTVTRGKVKVGDATSTLDFIIPNEQLIYEKQQGKAKKVKVNAAAYLQWKNEGELLLDNVEFKQAVALLEDRFKVSISLQDTQLQKKRFTTVLLSEESLEHIISSICEFNNAVYQFNKSNTALIIRNK